MTFDEPIRGLADNHEHTLLVDKAFSLTETCGPVTWGRGRWPGNDWIGGALVWVGREDDEIVARVVRQDGSGKLSFAGTRNPAHDEQWARDVLAVDRAVPTPGDPVIAEIAARYPGMRHYSAGSLFDGIVSCIAGQSISVAAAAITEARLCALFHPGIEMMGRRFWPMPSPEQLAGAEPALIRESGVTWKRAEAIVAAANAWTAGAIGDPGPGIRSADELRSMLLELPLVGPWTAESALLWGIGLDDAFPPNDAALLRAARLAYGDPSLTHPGLTQLAEHWRPARAWAARWLWLALFGPAPL